MYIIRCFISQQNARQWLVPGSISYQSENFNSDSRRPSLYSLKMYPSVEACCCMDLALTHKATTVSNQHTNPLKMPKSRYYPAFLLQLKIRLRTIGSNSKQVMHMLSYAIRRHVFLLWQTTCSIVKPILVINWGGLSIAFKDSDVWIDKLKHAIQSWTARTNIFAITLLKDSLSAAARATVSLLVSALPLQICPRFMVVKTDWCHPNGWTQAQVESCSRLFWRQRCGSTSWSWSAIASQRTVQQCPERGGFAGDSGLEQMQSYCNKASPQVCWLSAMSLSWTAVCYVRPCYRGLCFSIFHLDVFNICLRFKDHKPFTKKIYRSLACLSAAAKKRVHASRSSYSYSNLRIKARLGALPSFDSVLPHKH